MGEGDVTGPVRLPFARKRKEKKRKRLEWNAPTPYGTGFAIKAHENTLGQAWLWEMIQTFSGHFSCKGKGKYIRVFLSVEWSVPFKFPTKNSGFCWQMGNRPHITYNWKRSLTRSHSLWSFWMEASTSLFQTKLNEALAKKSDNLSFKNKNCSKTGQFSHTGLLWYDRRRSIFIFSPEDLISNNFDNMFFPIYWLKQNVQAHFFYLHVANKKKSTKYSSSVFWNSIPILQTDNDYRKSSPR